MPLSETILIIMGLLTVAMIAAGVCRNIAIPYTVFLVIIGMYLGYLARSDQHFHFLMEFQLTPELVLFLFLPALIFESAFNLDSRKLIKDLAPVLVLAIPALLISTFVIAIGLWLLLDIPFILALLFGALISATDPVAVIALFKELGAPERLTILVEGESLLNDATAIVIFKIILGLALGGVMLSGQTLGTSVLEFFRVFLGGIFIGVVLGFVLSELLYRLQLGISSYLIISIISAYISFAIAEHELHVSGVMAVVSAAITVSIFGTGRISQSATHFVKEGWEVIAMVFNSLLFLLVGLSVDLVRLLERFDAIFYAIILMLVARALTIYPMVPATIHCFHLPHVTLAERHIMWWGGLKGGLAIAIVLSIPTELVGRDLLLDMTLGVVLFSLLVNAATIRPLMKRLGIDRLSDDEKTELKHALSRAEQHVVTILNTLNKNGLVTSGTQQLVQKKTAQVLSFDETVIELKQNVRHLYITALRVEIQELKKLYDIGLIQHYTYMDIKSSLQRDRDNWLDDPGKYLIDDSKSKDSVFVRMENALIQKLREKDSLTGFLSRYQYFRLSQRLQRDFAGVMICYAVLDMLDENSNEFDASQLQAVKAIYQLRLERRKAGIDGLAYQFPEFFLRYETRLLAKVALIAANHYSEQALYHGEIGAKVFAQIDRRVRLALAELPAISNPAPQLKTSDLIGTVPLLNGLSDRVLEKLATQATSLTFLLDDIVIGEGERGDALYIINSGATAVYKRGQSKPIAELRAGDFFGEMALLGDQKRTATVKAIMPSTLLRLSRKDVLKLAQDDPELKRRLQQASAIRGDPDLL